MSKVEGSERVVGLTPDETIKEFRELWAKVVELHKHEKVKAFLVEQPLEVLERYFAVIGTLHYIVGRLGDAVSEAVHEQTGQYIVTEGFDGVDAEGGRHELYRREDPNAGDLAEVLAALNNEALAAQGLS